jgi:hypothetical protein
MRAAIKGIGTGLLMLAGCGMAAQAVEVDCVPLPSSVGLSVIKITLDSSRRKAYIYTIAGSKLEVDAAGDLVVIAVANDLNQSPSDSEIEAARNFGWQSVTQGACPQN